jgi:hypothetical protein
MTTDTLLSLWIWLGSAVVIGLLVGVSGYWIINLILEVFV